MMTERFDVQKYLADIVPQAACRRDACYTDKRTFLDQVKMYVAEKHITYRDYERITDTVRDALDV
jgi:hypothetical protein